MTAAKGRSKQSGPDPGSASRAAETWPDFQAGSQTSVLLQTIMELQKSIGGVDASVKTLGATVTDQSRKIDDYRTDLNARIDSKFEKLTQEIGTNRSEIAKYAGGVSVARWFVGTLIAIGVLIGGLLWRLPAIIEAIRAAPEAQ